MGILTPERKAAILGRIDAVLTALFVAFGFVATELAAWLLTALPQVTTSDWGRYNWAKVPVAIAIGAFIKGLDRKKHEDPSPDKGLINLPDELTQGE
jgi:hypothetical protein